MDHNSAQNSPRSRVFISREFPRFSFKFKVFLPIGILLILIILGFSLSANRFGTGDKASQIVIPKTENQLVVNKIFDSFNSEKAKELSDLVVQGDKEKDAILKYSAYQSAWSRMLGVYYYSGKKPEHKEALLKLKELLKKDPLYKEEDYEIKE